MIPASPAVMAPPIKKQRAGNTPEDPIAARTQSAISYRSERLQDLAQRYGTTSRGQQSIVKPNGNGPPNHISSTAPLASTGELLHSRGPPPQQVGMNGNRPTATLAPPVGSFNLPNNTANPPVIGMQHSVNAFQKAIPPPKPGMASMQPRRSDIFPTAPKSPISIKPSNSTITTATIQTAQPPQHHGEGAVARRLEETFQANGVSSPSSIGKDAPPSRPPPPSGPPRPPGPPPLVKEDSTKTVTFQVPTSTSIHTSFNRNTLDPLPQHQTEISPSTGSGNLSSGVSTPGANALLTKDAGGTPFYTALPPGTTPFRSNVAEDSTSPPTAARREILRNMREFAESPNKQVTSPNGSIESVKSPELRLHEQLASVEKDKTIALRKVAQLEDEILQLKQSSLPNHKNVGFMSPVANMLPSPVEKRSRRIGTPHPKASTPKPSTPTDFETERHFLIEATKKAPFEYDSDDGITFTVRRPYGLASEMDLWYKIGQLPAKLYAKSSNVESFSTIEVAATIACDDSIFLLFGDGDVRHQSNVTGISTDYGNVEERPTALGNVTYVDKNAIDKEYSLQDLYEYALSVRGHYCTTVRSFATALQLYPEPYTPNDLTNRSENLNIDVKPKAVETSDKAVVTDPEIKDKSTVASSDNEPQNQNKKQQPPPNEDETSDVLASFIQLFFSVIFGTVWFIFVTLPVRILTSTIVMAVSVVLLSYIWLFLAEGSNKSTSIHFNKPGIGIA